MAEHDVLIEQYNKYKNELSEYEKELYLYESKIEEYGKQIVAQIDELKRLGIDISFISEHTDENGELDLTDSKSLRELIDVVYAKYKEAIEQGLKYLNGGE